MDLYCGIADDRTTVPDHAKASNDVDQWQRWDEELVEEFGCWLRRLAKAFAILLIAVCTGVFLGLFK
jgi:hypothetical protein